MDLIKILLVDDHVLFRRGIKGIIEDDERLKVVGEGNNGKEAYKLALETKPDIILMDIRMPECNGIEALKMIKKELPEIKVIMLTVEDEDEYLFEAIKNGAQGYLLKNIDPEELIIYIEGILRGEAPLSKELAAKILAEFTNLAKASSTINNENTIKNDLTQREKEVLKLVSLGATNKGIASELCISENTVKNHMRNILDKLHIQNRVQAAAYAMREGLI